MVNGAQFINHSPLILNAFDNKRVKEIGYWRWIEETVKTRWPRLTTPIQWHPQGTLSAEINHGQWVVKCPLADCGGAVITAPGLRFFCIECLNATNQGRAYEVVFPDDLEAIEHLLSLRPNPANRNYLPGETIHDLTLENIQHDVAIG